MAEDLTVPRNATLTNDAPPLNSADASEDLTLPDGRPAPFRVECNVGGEMCVGSEMSISVPAAEVFFSVWQRVRRRGEQQLVDSVQVVCGEGVDGSITVRVLIRTPKFPDGLQIALLTSRPGDASTDNDFIDCDLGHKKYESW